TTLVPEELPRTILLSPPRHRLRLFVDLTRFVGEQQTHGGALSGIAFDLQGAATVLNAAVDARDTHAEDARSLGREIRVDDRRAGVLVHTEAGVLHVDHQVGLGSRRRELLWDFLAG